MTAIEGKWILSELEERKAELRSLQEAGGLAGAIDGQAVTQLDTAGAALIIDSFSREGDVTFENFSAPHRKLLELVKTQAIAKPEQKNPMQWNFVRSVGEITLQVWQHILGTVSALGQVLTALFLTLLNPKRLRKKELAVQIELTLVNALFVIGLVTFLIGIVVAYLFAGQIQRYGANIFIVDGVTLAMARELSPIIVATVMAGRSGSAFTAQIGSMKINQEIDAIRMLGLSPIEVLVVPRVLALILAVPLLVFFGDVVGIGGGMILANHELGVTAQTFLERVRTVIPTRHFIVGLIKAPVFALFIGIIGCRMGLNVENNARSLGLHTTSTVVQSIVLVIILDALFAVIFMKLGY